MTRLKYNGVNAILGGSGLTNSGTTVTFVAGLTYNGGTSVPTITGSDYIPLSILDTDGVLAEIVYLTAYTSGATTGTITRGQESTSGVAHAAGVQVINAPTVLDLTIPAAAAYSNPIDDPSNWTADLGWDEEFSAGTMASPSTSLPSGWSWANQGSCTYSESLGVGAIVAPTDTLNNHVIYQSLSGAPSTWNLYAKAEYALDTGGNYWEAGIQFREASTGKAIQLGVYTGNAGGMQAMILSWSSNTGGGFSYGPGPLGGFATAKYWRIRKNSGTSYDYLISRDGVCWYTVLAGANPGFTPDQIGFGVSNNGQPQHMVGLQWFRLR